MNPICNMALTLSPWPSVSATDTFLINSIVSPPLVVPFARERQQHQQPRLAAAGRNVGQNGRPGPWPGANAAAAAAAACKCTISILLLGGWAGMLWVEIGKGLARARISERGAIDPCCHFGHTESNRDSERPRDRQRQKRSVFQGYGVFDTL